MIAAECAEATVLRRSSLDTCKRCQRRVSPVRTDDQRGSDDTHSTSAEFDAGDTAVPFHERTHAAARQRCDASGICRQMAQDGVKGPAPDVVAESRLTIRVERGNVSGPAVASPDIDPIAQPAGFLDKLVETEASQSKRGRRLDEMCTSLLERRHVGVVFHQRDMQAFQREQPGGGTAGETCTDYGDVKRAIDRGVARRHLAVEDHLVAHIDLMSAKGTVSDSV